MESREVRHRFTDGASVTLRFFDAPAPTATVVVAPALGVLSGYYRPLAQALGARGFSCVLFDVRGTGESSVRPSRAVQFGYRRLIDDLTEVCALVKGAVVPLGHSLGGQLLVVGACLEPSRFERFALVASSTPFIERYPPRTARRMRLLRWVIKASRVLGYYPGNWVGFAGRESLQLMNEWAQLAITGSLPLEAEPPTRVHDVLAISIADDWFAPPSALSHLLEKLPAAEVERLHLDAELAPNARDHFRWARQPEPVVDAFARWFAHGRTG